MGVDLEAEEPTHHETHLHRPINSQEGFVHQTKTDNKQPGRTCNLTKTFPYPIPPIIVHNPDDVINEINKLAMIHQEQGDINARYSKPPSTNITKIDTPDHNCQANTAGNPNL